jgi:AGCS family alanine or glycine:cation symporter
VALTAGGPGALVWMWVTAFLGSIIQYASCVLAVKYRVKKADGDYAGGPMYYLRDGLGLKTIGILFAVFTVCGALAVGNFAQVNSIVLPLRNFGVDPLLCGVLIALFVACVTLGGIQRVAKFASIFVPLKATLYLGTAFIIIAMNWQEVLPAFGVMFKSAFHISSATGGILGYGIAKAISTGFDRGVFATDAGTGIVPILQASAKTKNPVIDGVVSLVAPLLVMIVCTTTGLVLIITGAWQQPNLQSTNMVTYAFETGAGTPLASYVVIIALVLFAYTSIIAWSCCAEKAIGFLFGQRMSKWFNYFFVIMIPVGAIIQVDWVWLLADLSISFMLITNMIGVVGLAHEVVDESREFFPVRLN